MEWCRIRTKTNSPTDQSECQIRERTHVIVAITFCQKLVAARFMAGSATSVAEAVVFEICGLIAEVVVINQYLRGFTPWMKLKMDYRSATKLFFSKKTSVAPDTDLSDDNCDSETEGLRLEFCASLFSIRHCAKEFASLPLLHTFSLSRFLSDQLDQLESSGRSDKRCDHGCRGAIRLRLGYPPGFSVLEEVQV